MHSLLADQESVSVLLKISVSLLALHQNYLFDWMMEILAGHLEYTTVCPEHV